jgi:hypothetical protein
LQAQLKTAQAVTTMTQKLNIHNSLQGWWTRTTGYNTGLAKVAVQCSADTFVVNQRLVLRINPDSFRDGENRHLRQARNRWLHISLNVLIA